MTDRRCKPEYLDATGNAVRANIRMLRMQRGLSLARLADLLDDRGWPCGEAVPDRIEKGFRHVRVDELAIFAKIFRVDMAAMLTPMTLADVRDIRRRDEPPRPAVAVGTPRNAG